MGVAGLLIEILQRPYHKCEDEKMYDIYSEDL